MANVKFLRGSQSNFDKITSFTPGAFYLTEDTHRLYAANAAGNGADLLSQAVVTVANVAALSTMEKVDGQFYYAKAENVLCVFDKNQGTAGEYRQINEYEDTKLSSLSHSFGGSSNAVTLKTKAGIVNRKGGALPDISSNSLTIKGAGDITVTSTDSELTITDKAYNIAVGNIDDDQKGATINLTKGTDDTVAGSIKLATTASGGINFSKDANDALVITTVQNDPSVDVTSSAEATGFSTRVQVGGKSDTDNIDPIIQLGSHSTDSELIHFKNGKAVLDVYTKGEVDEIEHEIDALKYKGVVNSSAALPTKDVEIGWMYKVGTPFGDYKVNDLLIANGTEGDDGKISGTVTWDHISCADGVDTKYNFAASGTKVVLKENGTQDVGEIEVVGDGTYLSANGTVSSDGKKSSVKISHIASGTEGTKGSSDTTDVSGFSTTGANYTAIVGVDVDAAGHVTGVKQQKLTVRDTVLKQEGTAGEVTGSASNNVANLTLKAKIQDTAGSNVHADMSFSVGSSSLEVKEDTAGAVTVNLVWESFDPAA